MKNICEQLKDALAPDKLIATVGEITQALEKMFADYSLPVVLENVEINDTVISIDISITDNNEKSETEIHFYVDSKGVPQALVFDDDDDDKNDEHYIYSLENIASKENLDAGEVVNLIVPTWLEEQVFIDIISADLESELEEKFAFVVRDGKKVKKQLVRQKRRKVLTPKQKAGIRKAVKSRKAKKGQTARKRKISNKLRKRMKIGKNKDKNLKVAGTSSRK